MFDKETILNKSKFFPGSSKYFKLDYQVMMQIYTFPQLMD